MGNAQDGEGCNPRSGSSSAIGEGVGHRVTTAW